MSLMIMNKLRLIAELRMNCRFLLGDQHYNDETCTNNVTSAAAWWLRHTLARASPIPS